MASASSPARSAVLLARHLPAAGYPRATKLPERSAANNFPRYDDGGRFRRGAYD